MKCDNCKYFKSYTLSYDECGCGNRFDYCQKGHWEGGVPPEPEEVKDPWTDCKDFNNNL